MLRQKVTLNIFYCIKRQKDKTQVKQLRQSSPIDRSCLSFKLEGDYMTSKFCGSCCFHLMNFIRLYYMYNANFIKILNTLSPVLRGHLWDKEKVAL